MFDQLYLENILSTFLEKVNLASGVGIKMLGWTHFRNKFIEKTKTCWHFTCRNEKKIGEIL